MQSNNPISNPNFVRWFGSSKVKDKFGQPRIVYHGTQSEFTHFDYFKTNQDNFFGRGFYFSSSKVDINKNYATSSGPDPQLRLSNAIDQVYDDPSDAIEYYNNKYNTEIDEENENEVDKAINVYASEVIMGRTNEGSVMPCYLHMEKPCYVGFGDRDTFFEFNQNYDEESDEYGEPTGLGADLANFLSNYNIDIYEDMISYQGLSAFKLLRTIGKEISEKYIEDNDGNLYIPGVLFAEFLKETNFDGIIQKPAMFFRSMNNVQRAFHYIVWEPNQIKSATGNNGNYSLDSNDIRESFSMTKLGAVELQKFKEAVNYEYYKDKIDQQTFEWLISLDPTKDKKYSRWIIEWWLKEYITPALEIRQKSIPNFPNATPNFPLSFKQAIGEDDTFWLGTYYSNPQRNQLLRFYQEDGTKVIEDLTWYIKLKNKKVLENESEYNIMNIKGFKALWGLINAKYADEIEEIEANEPIPENEYIKLYEDSQWLVVIPKTERASCKYGQGTRWCTAGKKDNQFKNYTRGGEKEKELIIVIDKSNPRKNKWQIHFDSKQFMDIHDDPVKEPLELIKSWPSEVNESIYNNTHAFLFSPHKKEDILNLLQDPKRWGILQKDLERENFVETLRNKDITNATEIISNNLWKSGYVDYAFENDVDFDNYESYTYGYDHPWEYLKANTIPGNLGDLEDCEYCGGMGYALYVVDKSKDEYTESLDQEQYDHVLSMLSDKKPELVEPFKQVYSIKDKDGRISPNDEAAAHEIMKEYGQKCRMCQGTGKEDYDKHDPDLWSEEQREEAGQSYEEVAREEAINEGANYLDQVRNDKNEAEKVYNYMINNTLFYISKNNPNYGEYEIHNREVIDTILNLLILFNIINI